MWRFDAYPTEHRSPTATTGLPALPHRHWILIPVLAVLLIIGGIFGLLTATADAVAAGQVIASDSHRHFGRRVARTTYHVTVQYRPSPLEDPQLTMAYTGHQDYDRPVGSLIDVYYDPQNPSRASFTSASSQRQTGTLMTAGGALLALVWTGAWVWRRNNRRLE